MHLQSRITEDLLFLFSDVFPAELYFTKTWKAAPSSSLSALYVILISFHIRVFSPLFISQLSYKRDRLLC